MLSVLQKDALQPGMFIDPRATQIGTCQTCLAEICTAQVSGQARPTEISPLKEGSPQIGQREIGFLQNGLTKICALQIGGAQIDARKRSVAKIGTAQIRPLAIDGRREPEEERLFLQAPKVPERDALSEYLQMF
uniref:Uncharacterized protein n=1 Tax=Thermogemmatispora argillosa TaxID=2045280 RepID=A0A455SY93_9CHLR|nr:hypothetical protein KTA_06670 [Thermogemmatispora argillosa]